MSSASLSPPARTGAELELAERVLHHCEGPAQVTVTRERSLFSRFARSAATQATSVDDVTIEVLSVRDGHTAAAVTNAVDDAALAATASAAAAAAEATARMAGAAGDYPGLPAPHGGYPHVGHDSATAELEPAVAAAALAGAFTAAGAGGFEAFGLWTAGEVRVAIASTEGIRACDAVTDAHMRVICRDAQGRSGFAAQTAVAAATIDAELLAAVAAAKIDAREPRELAPGEYPVVLEAEAVGELLAFLGGLAFNGLAYAEGRGALSGLLGTRVAAPCVSLADTTRPLGMLPRAFDAEGVPKRPLPLIQDGIAHAVVHDTRSAARVGGGARSTAHALRAGGDPHGPEPTNMFLLGGGCVDLDELTAPIERGLLVTRLWYVNTVHEKETLLTGMSRDGTFLIEGGEVTVPLRDVRFTDSVLRILAATEALHAMPRLVSDGAFYGRRFAHGVLCPALRANGFRVTGSTVG